MLTTLLVLATTAFSVQDAPAAPPDAPAAAAPSETPAPVKSFLDDAEKLLYDPQAAGLKSLEFTVPVNVPQLGNVGSEHVKWSADAPPVFSFTKDAAASLPPQVPVEMLEGFGAQFGQQLLDSMLNRPISSQLRGAVAQMGAPEAGLVRIDLMLADAEEQGVKERAFLFDGDGLLQKTRTVLEMPAGPTTLKVTVLENYTWATASADSELLVPTELATEADMGMMGKQRSTVSFVRRVVGDVLLPVEMTMASSGMGGDQKQVIPVTGLVVNGTRVPDAAPAAPAPPAGG